MYNVWGGGGGGGVKGFGMDIGSSSSAVIGHQV